jgi:glycosyltransferase involved in cell wall biosynthesis
MNFLTFLRRLRVFFLGHPKHKHRPKISLLIPFSSNDPERKKSFKWLLKYWKCQLPHAEIIIGRSRSEVFCKGEALNDAFERSTGKILAIIDADAYFKGSTIKYCADEILEAEARGHNLWFVPYRRLYRLTKEVSDYIRMKDPCHPYLPWDPIPEDFYDNKGFAYKYGHRYGAMATIVPRKALEEVLHCFDERFKGWGGEDIAFLRAMDTLFGKNKSVDENMFHLWHKMIGDTVQKRMWDRQTGPNPNGNLTYKYHLANRQYHKMKKIIDEAYEFYLKTRGRL